MCAVNVYFSDKLYKAEFAVLAQSAHNVILGLDFLQQRSATLDYGTGELFLPPLADLPSTC